MGDITESDIRRLDGGLLLIFRALLRRRRTTAVAEELGLSQSAVSHALTRLRDLFDDPLFMRRPHGLEPTRHALELGPRIESLIDQLGNALEKRSSFDPTRSERRFQISAPEFVTALLAPELIKRLRTLAPRVQFVIGYLSPSQSLQAVRRGEIDLALGRFSTPMEGLTSKIIYQDHYCVAARRGHPLYVKGRITGAQYKSIGHVFAHSESETGPEYDLITPEIVYHATVPGWLMVLTVVAECDSIATAPRKLVERQAKRLGLQILKAPFTPFTVEVGAARRAESQDAGVDWLLDQIRAAIAA